MFNDFIVQPIFNLLSFIYATIPGHNFGLAIILFTIVVRLLMWPLVKKQLHQVKLMRKIQPELKRIKKDAAGDKRKEQMMMLELYKERGINPFSQIGILLLQLPILLGLYIGLQKVVKDPNAMVTFSYPFIQDLGWLKELAANSKLFDATLFGWVDLTKAAIGSGGVYWPALVIVTGSAVAQYYQSKQLAPDDKDARRIRDILSDAKKGKQADPSEMNAAMGRNIRYILPVLVFLFTVYLPAALSLYWLMSGLVAYLQQAFILREDVAEMEASVDGGATASKKTSGKTKVTISTKSSGKAAVREKKAVEAEIVETPKAKAKASTKAKTVSSSKTAKKPARNTRTKRRK